MERQGRARLSQRSSTCCQLASNNIFRDIIPSLQWRSLDGSDKRRTLTIPVIEKLERSRSLETVETTYILLHSTLNLGVQVEISDSKGCDFQEIKVPEARLWFKSHARSSPLVHMRQRPKIRLGEREQVNKRIFCRIVERGVGKTHHLNAGNCVRISTTAAHDLSGVESFLGRHGVTSDATRCNVSNRISGTV